MNHLPRRATPLPTITGKITLKSVIKGTYQIQDSKQGEQNVFSCSYQPSLFLKKQPQACCEHVFLSVLKKTPIEINNILSLRLRCDM